MNMIKCKNCKWFVDGDNDCYYPSDPYCEHESCFEKHMISTSDCYRAKYGIKEIERSKRIDDYCSKNKNNDCPNYEKAVIKFLWWKF